MTDIALSLFRSSSDARPRQMKDARIRIEGRWSYKLLIWAFRNS